MFCFCFGCGSKEDSQEQVTSPPATEHAIGLGPTMQKLATDAAGKLPVANTFSCPPNWVQLEYGLEGEDNQNFGACDLFNEAEKRAAPINDETRRRQVQNNVWIVGPIGCGKTYLCKNFVQLATQNKIGFEAKYIFFIQCDKLNLNEKRCLPEFLANAVNLPQRFESELRALNEIEGVLFVFDAIDEISIENLVQRHADRVDMTTPKTGYQNLHDILSGKSCPNAKKLWTSNKVFYRELKGKYKRIQETLVFNVLPLTDVKLKQFFLPKKLPQLDPFLKSLCRSPFYAATINSIRNSKKAMKTTYFSVSNLLCAALERIMQENQMENLRKLSEIAWNKCIGNNYAATAPSSDQSETTGSSDTQDLAEQYAFIPLLYRIYMAALHAMASLNVNEFKSRVNFESMTSERWEVMSLCLFGMCDSSRNKYVSLQADEIEEEKVAHLKAIAVKVAREAKVANGYDERIQSLFLVGRWMQEANSDDMISAVSTHLPTKVALADKIYPNDVFALSYLARSHEMELTLGIMSSPRFQDDAALLFWKQVGELRQLTLCSVDLRGCDISDAIGVEIGKCVSKMKSMRLDGAKVFDTTLTKIVKSIAKVPRESSSRLKLQLGDSKMRVGMDLMNALSQAVKNLTELTIIVQHAPVNGCSGLVKAVSKLKVEMDLLDLGIPTLNKKIARKLGRNSHKFKCLRLRGCEGLGHDALCTLIKEIHDNKVQMRGLYLDHVDVTERDVQALCKCLNLFKCWLTLMYCGVTKRGFDMLKASHEALGPDNPLQIFLGDVEGVGDSQIIRN